MKINKILYSVKEYNDVSKMLKYNDEIYAHITAG